MSKKFIKPGLAQLFEPEVNIDDPHLHGQRVVVDTNFLLGKRFLAHAKAWLTQNPGNSRLYYYALMPHISVEYGFDDKALGQELAEKWPPLLPGLQTVVLAQGRIELMLWVGDQAVGLSHLITHFDADVQVKYKKISIDDFILSLPISKEALEMVEFLRGEEKTIKRLKNSPWPYGENHPESKETKVIIIGGGLAGCYLAHTMAEVGWEVFVFESNAQCGTQGSGNRFSVLYPKLSLYQAPFTELLHQAYPYAYQVWREFLTAQPSLGWCLPLWQQGGHDVTELSEILDVKAGWFEQVNTPAPGLLMKKSLILDMPKLCNLLLQHPNIKTYYEHEVKALEYRDGQWEFGSRRAPYCVLANGYQASEWPETRYFGIKGMRGQMTHVSGFSDQDVVYCHQGHFLPKWRGVHAVGASYQSKYHDLNPSPKDDDCNLKPWLEFFKLESMDVV